MKKGPPVLEGKDEPSTSTAAEVYNEIAAIYSHGGTREIRALYPDNRTLSRIAATAEEAARAICALPPDYRGVYITLNPVGIVSGSARDTDVSRRHWMLIDLDPERPASASATDAEYRAAVMHGVEMASALSARGWPDPRIVMSGNGCHLLYPVDLPNDPAATALVKGALHALAAVFDTPAVKVDTSVCNASRIVRVPGTLARKGPNTPERPHRRAFVIQEAGEGIVTNEQLSSLALPVAAHAPLRLPAPPVSSGAGPYGRAALESACRNIAEAPYGEHNTTANREAFGIAQLALAGRLDWTDARTRLHGAMHGVVDPMADGVIESILDRGLRDAESKPLPTDRLPVPLPDAAEAFTVPESPQVLQPLAHYTDARDTQQLHAVGLMRRLARQWADVLRFVPQWNTWIHWSDNHWTKTDTGSIVTLALRTAPDLIYREGLEAAAVREACAKFARKASEPQFMSGVISALSGMPEMRVSPAELDADPWLCGVDAAQQVVDLRTGCVRPATPADYITKSLGVSSIGDAAKAMRWRQFLDEVFVGDRELIDWMLRFMGYCLTGLTAEQLFVFAYGHGANGKSVLMQVLLWVFGDFGASVSPATLCDDRRTGSGASPDLARLDGIRLAVASEAEEGSRFNEQLVKAMVSGDPMPVRHLHCAPFDMRPVLKLLGTGNHRPHINGTDRGIWRRVRLVPFRASFEGRADPHLADKLHAELPHIAAALAAGAIEWQRRGLRDMPRAIAEATEAYREESDLLGAWLAEHCTQSLASEERAADLYSSFTLWASRNGIQRPWTAPTFGKNLASYSIGGWLIGERKGTGGVRWRTGIRLNRTAEVLQLRPAATGT